MGHWCFIGPYGSLSCWGGAEAGFFLEFLVVCHLHLSMEILELGVVTKAIEQTVHQRGSSSSPHAGGS